MSKSQVNALLHVARGIFKDIQATYPALKGLSQDIERTALYAKTRGLSFFSLDLPHLDSLLLKGLETGSLSLHGPLSKAKSYKIQVPKYLSGLWLLVFKQDANLRQKPDVNAIFFLRQLCCLGKKIEVEPTEERRNATVQKFHDVESVLREPSLTWHLDELGGRRLTKLHLHDAVQKDLPLLSVIEDTVSNQQRLEDYRLLRHVQQVADLVVGRMAFLNPPLYSESLEQDGLGAGFRHGPGAVSEGLRNWEKSEFPNWPTKLEGTFPYEHCGKTAGSETERPLNHERPSRLICVPKTAKGPRLIAAEPVAHQWCQQLVWSFLEDEIVRLFRGAFINFRKQSLSGDLVLRASLDRKLATVDLSDASDRLTCWTVERLFRSNPALLNALHAARTRYLLDEVRGGRTFLRLKKFASQGTAVTFPVQSLVFLFISLGACIKGEVTWEKIWKLSRQVRVYGDDIIIPSYGYERLCRVMELLQLKVNTEKSYVHGHFRESCGTDGYMGHDVTPVKPKTIVVDGPASCQAVLDISNNLFNKGLWHASEHLRSHLPVFVQRNIRIVGPHDAGSRGFTSFCGSDEHHLKKRWNRRLHRDEVRVWQFSVKLTRKPRGEWSSLLDFFVKRHSASQARIVSEYDDTRQRRIKASLAWEPSNHSTRVSH